MKSFIVFALFVAAAVAAPPLTSDADATVIRSENNNIGVDGYNTAYETSNGIAAQEEGTVVKAGTDEAHIAVRGQFAYTGPDGVVYSVSYTADEEGFKPSGAHLPVA